jgi:WD40 repeat protein
VSASWWSDWDAETASPVCTYLGHIDWVWSVDIADDNSKIASGSSDNLAKLWDAETCEEIRSFGPIIDWYITGVDLSPDGNKLLTFSDAKNVFVIFDADNGDELLRVDNQKTAYGSFNADATAVITGGSDGRIAAWNAEDGGLVWEFPTSATSIARPAAISPVGNVAAAVGNDWKVYLIDLDTGALLRTFDNNGETVTGAIFSPDGAALVLTSFDQTVKILDTATFDLLAKLGPYDDRTRGAKFSPDGLYLYVSSDEGVVRKFDLNRVLVP